MLSSAYDILRLDCNNLKPHILIFILTYANKHRSNIDVNKLPGSLSMHIVTANLLRAGQTVNFTELQGGLKCD